MFRNLKKREWTLLIALAVITFILMSAYPSSIAKRDYCRIVFRVVWIIIDIVWIIKILKRAKLRSEIEPKL